MNLRAVLVLLVILVLLVPGPLGWRRRRRRRCWRNCSWSGWSYHSDDCSGDCGGDGRTTYTRYVTVFAQCGGSCFGSGTKYEPCIGSCNHGTWKSNAGNGYCECNSGFTGTCCESEVVCSDLPPPPHGSATGGHTYQEIKTFSCDAGYRLEGSAIRECTASGTWTGSDTVCNRIQCSQLNPPTHGSVHGGNNYNDIVHFSCNTGHALTGSYNRTWQENGLWTGTQPTCTAQECPELDTPLNGQKTGGTSVGSFLIFFCNEGYDLTGGDIMRTCQPDQTWSGTDSTCERKICPVLSRPLNGNITGGHLYGDVVTFTCTAGYDLTGSETMTCQSNGQWGGLQPLCSRAQCPALSPIANGQMSGGNLFGQQVSFVCNSGYHLVGSSSRICQADRSWSGTQPSCDVVECALPKAQPNSHIALSGTTYGETVTSTCYPGYELSSGNSVRTCQAGGRWTGTPPLCERKCCGEPSLQYGSYSGAKCYNETIFLQCYEGHYLTSPDSDLTCTDKGTWDSPIPECDKVCCNNSIAVDNGYLAVPSGYCFDSTIQIHCDLGYKLTGNAGILYCNASGVWEGEEPRCEKINCGDPGDIRNGRKDMAGTFYGDTLTYSCDPGFILVGNDTYTCDADGDWGPAPFCEAHSLCDRTQLASPSEGSKICFNSPDGATPVEYCQIHCNPSYMYTSTDGMYECSVDTSWRWVVRRMYSGISVFNIVPVGDCSPGFGLWPGMTVDGLTITAEEPLDMEAIEDEMRYQLGLLGLCNNPCEIGQITVEISNSRKRSQGIQYRISVQLRAYADPTLISPTNTIQMQWMQIVGELRQKAMDLQTLIHNGGLILPFDGQTLSVDGHGIIISNPSLDCRDGEIKQGLNCFPCGPGTYYDVYESICRPCEYATYQDEFGRTECKPCPEKTTTEGPGAKDMSACKAFADCNCGVNPCILNSTGYFCHCLPGYQARGDDCIDIDECADPSICPNALCLNRPGTYSCQCLPGYDGPICADVDECRYGNYCPDHSTCTNTDGDYYCTCDHGYQGDNCKDTDECHNATLNTCRPDQICVNTAGSFHCDDCTVFDGRCYIVSDTRLTFTEAEMKCAEQGGLPVTVKDQQVQDFLVQELSVANKDVWIGLTDQDVEGQFVWTDGSPLAYSNWAPGEPNGDSTKNCVHLWPLANFRWDDMPCGRRNYYICHVTLPYVAGVTEAITRKIRKTGVAVHSTPHTTIRRLLVAPKDKDKPDDTCGVVYHLTCEDCDAQYVGETERALKKRISEHKRDSSPVAQHMQTYKHQPTKKVTILDRESRWFERGVKEAVHIRSRSPSLNRDQGRHRLPPIYNSLVQSRDLGDL
ncbi:CSMD3 [Branchiostoma lanceolatum]|uniref:CSMD3 protein n=1 Tax=Branchiostoma lanceolatum TaxID=7740 RepID=A0A8K0EHK8_BRALA|nr:CSMD3 [Branchiostoma lanceolatum]